MNITLDQARALDATVRFETIQKAAKFLNKGHSAILYMIQTLEEQTNIKVFDRSGYRNQLTPQGKVVLKYCQEMLSIHHELEVVCHRLHEGWEPKIHLIYDGVVDFNIIANALLKTHRKDIPTEFKIQAGFLEEVEKLFHSEQADLMLTILPIHHASVVSIPLEPIEMLLVAHRNHEIHRLNSSKKLSVQQLEQHSYVVVRDSNLQLGLSTDGLKFKSNILVNDFPTKREAILRNLGFGWLPKYIIEKQLSAGTLKIVKSEIENKFVFYPHLYHRKTALLGLGTQELIQCLTGK